jgi:hypothetical protein
MSTYLEPRVVEKPYRKRWLRMTLQLLARAPLRFGAAIALLALLDATAVKWLRGMVILRLWMQWLGMLSLPFAWALVSAIARGADDRSQTWQAFGGFRRLRLWGGIFVAGAYIAALNWVADSLLLTRRAASVHYVNKSGALLSIWGAQYFMVYIYFGVCFLPLLVSSPQLSVLEARRLSYRATELNDRREFMRLQLLVALIGLALSLIPSYGVSEAAWVVFMGILNYVAYRDIFERRASNSPIEVPALAPVPLAQEGLSSG